MKWFLLGLLVVAGKIYGTETPGAVKNYNLYLGVDGVWAHSTPKIEGASVKRNAFLVGPSFEFEYRKPRGFYFDACETFAFGTHHYHLKIHEGWNGKKHHENSATWSNGALGFGYTFNPMTSLLVSLYTGPGFYRQTFGDNTDRWLYWQFGLKMTKDWANCLNAGVDVKTYVKSDFWGFNVGVPLLWYLESRHRWGLRVKPYFLKMDTKGSEVVVGLSLEGVYSF